MKNQTVDFEGIENKFSKVLRDAVYHLLIKKVEWNKKIFLMGNGGLHFVAGHASTDMTRLIDGKAFYSFDSVGFITSNANDHGYDHLFVRWLETVLKGVEDPTNTLLVGLSCSGNSANVINAMEWGKNNNCSTFMISGVKSKVLPKDVDELVFDCTYYHTVEVLTLMLFYDIIHKLGFSCPTIGTLHNIHSYVEKGAGVHCG